MSFRFVSSLLLILAGASQAAEFNVMTYNAAFLPFVSKKFGERKTEFAHEVAQRSADILCFQEVWMPNTRARLVRDFRQEGYPYSAWVKSRSFFPRGMMGHGLLVVSKFPIGEVRFQSFQSYTRPEEFFARKGILKVPVDIPGMGRVNVFNLHLGAVSFVNSLRNFHPKHLATISSQLEDAIQFILRERDAEVPEIVMGDFNLNPTVWDSVAGAYSPHVFRSPYLHFREALGLVDIFPEATAETPEAWITWDPTRNPLIRKNAKPKVQGLDPRSRFDYIWYSPDAWKLVDRSVVMDDRQGKIMSDHFGLEAVFEFKAN